MRRSLIATLFLLVSLPGFAQNVDADPATKDDVILLFQTMHSHDMMRRLLEVQSKAMQQLLQDQFAKEKGRAGGADFEALMSRRMEDLSKNMPLDEMTQAMIPAYQKYFTHGDIEAMNAFYSSPVGQKVLQELPEVSQEGMQAVMPILSKYLNEWKERLQQDLKQTNSTSPQSSSQKDEPKTN